MEQVTGIEPASPAWKAGALTIVLHLHLPSVEIVSLDIVTYGKDDVKQFTYKFLGFFLRRKATKKNKTDSSHLLFRLFGKSPGAVPDAIERPKWEVFCEKGPPQFHRQTIVRSKDPRLAGPPLDDGRC